MWFITPFWLLATTVSHDVQVLVMMISLSCNVDCIYTLLCIVADLPQLADRREQLTKRQFVKMADTELSITCQAWLWNNL